MNQLKESELELFPFKEGKFNSFRTLQLMDIALSWGLNKGADSRQHFRSFTLLVREKVESLIQKYGDVPDRQDDLDSTSSQLSAPTVVSNDTSPPTDSISSPISTRNRPSCSNKQCVQAARTILSLKAERNRLLADLKRSEQALNKQQDQLNFLRSTSTTQEDLKQQLSELTKHQLKILEKLEDRPPPAFSPATSSLSYAAVASFPQLPKKEAPAIILSPVDKNLTIQELETELNTLPVKNIKLDCSRTKNGKLLVKTSSPDSIAALKETLNPLKNKIQIEEKKPRRAKIIIFDAPKAPKREQSESTPLLDKYKEDFILPALERYLGTPEVEYKIFRVMRSSDGYGSNLVLEMDHRHAIILQNYKKLTLGFNRCGVKEYFTVTRCTKCQSLEHSTKSCPPENRHFCGKCSRNHVTQDCNSQESFCINCHEQNKSDSKGRDTGHPAISGRCPLFKEKLKALMENKQFSSNRVYSNRQQHSR